MNPELPGALARLAPLLTDYGYLAVAVLVLLDNALLPVPGQTVLIAAAVYAGAGRLNIVAVIVTAVLAAVAGDCLGYLIGRSGGRAVVHRFGRYLLLTPARFARGEEFFTRNGGKVVTVARFVDGLRQTNGVLAGITGMPWRRFLVCNALGACLWVGVWSGLGYAAGTSIDTLYTQAVRYQAYLLIVLALAAVALLGRHLLRGRRARRLRTVQAAPDAAGPHRSRTPDGPTAAGADSSPEPGGQSVRTGSGGSAGIGDDCPSLSVGRPEEHG